MLQQTQTGRVIDAYLRFADKFPTPGLCAAAERSDVVRAWAGLGYNRRALNLHRAATFIVRDHGGQLPESLPDLLALPGVGEYTARAVLVFGFGWDVGVVDTNAARVLARMIAGKALRRKEAQALADTLVRSGQAWEINQAVFDFGATICSRRSPKCGSCPMVDGCAWAQQGWPSPDPAVASAGSSRGQSPFDGSERQARGRLVAALRAGPVELQDVANITGWRDQPERLWRMIEGLVDEQLVRHGGEGPLELG